VITLQRDEMRDNYKQQHRLRLYGHVLRKVEKDWVKKCMDFEVEGLRKEKENLVRGHRKKDC